MRTRALVGVLLTGLLAGPVVPAGGADAIPDPTVPGPHGVTIVEYNAGLTVAAGIGAEVWVDELRGALYVPSAAGPRPVLLLLHGFSTHTCEDYMDQDLSRPYDHECQFAEHVPMHRGFDYLGRNLASHGYLVVSVLTRILSTTPSGAGVTDSGATERAELLAQTLDRLAQWNAGPGPGAVGTTLVGKVDLTRIGAMGHSRGGDGVTSLIEHMRTRIGPRYPLKGVVALASVDARKSAPYGVPYGVIVPVCDGDVQSMGGALMWDRGRFVDPDERAARVQFTIRGANHNYFNTVWDWDDAQFPEDGPNPACVADHPTSVRMSGDAQRRLGGALMAAFFRRYVGGETAFDPLMTGAAPLPAAACPDGPIPCDEVLGTSYLAPAADRTLVLTGDTLDRTDLGGAMTLDGFAESRVCHPTYPYDTVRDTPPTVVGYLDQWDPTIPAPNLDEKHFADPTVCPSDPTRSAAMQLALRYDGPATLTAALSPRPTGTFDASGFTTLTFRTAVNFPEYGDPSPDVEVVLRDGRGRAARVSTSAYPSAALHVPDGSARREVLLNGVRLPLRAFGGIRLAELTAVELHFGGTGAGFVQLAELAFQRS